MTILQYPKCGTCRKAIKWLNENNIDVTLRDITVDNPTKDELNEWIARSGLPCAKFFNTSGHIYKEQNLKEKVKVANRDEMIGMLSENGKLVKRPLLISDNFVLVGFNEDGWAKHLLEK